MEDDDPREPIKLLEVVEGTIERGIEPISFMPDPSHGIEYPSMIVEVSPAEYEAIKKGGNGRLEFEGYNWTIGVELSAH